MSKRHPVLRLELPLPAAQYDSALVFGLPARLAAAVEELRGKLPWEVPADDQLVPHLTVLFLGRMEGAKLLDLQRAFADLRPVEVDIGLGDLDTFVSASRVSNLHLRVRGDAGLRTLHQRALKACRAAGWEPQTLYLENRYLPHITIVDGVDVDANGLVLPSPPVPPATVVRLDDLYLLAKRGSFRTRVPRS